MAAKARPSFLKRQKEQKRAQKAVETFRAHDEATLLKQLAVFRDEQQLIQSAQDAARELEQLFEADREEK